MTDTTLTDAMSLNVFDSSRQPLCLSPADAATQTALSSAPPPPLAPPGSPPSSSGKGDPCPGRLLLNAAALRRLRNARLLSQQDLADDCWRRNIRVSIATIKRAESGHAVRFRIARELARCFDVPVDRLLVSSRMEDIAMDEQNGLLAAVRDTLMHIAGVSGTAAKRLRPGQSLDADLGFDEPDFAVLAGYQNEVASRLRSNGMAAPRLTTDALRDCVVWEVCALTIRHAVGRELNLEAVAALIGRAQAGLRSGV
jgi:DNA-binding XRE family transcriptional regulator